MKEIRTRRSGARRPKVMDQVRATGEPVVVTRRGAPVVKVIPVESQESDIFGFMAGEFVIVGDIESRPLPLKQWKISRR
jgi:antitoxin (DNA-binding transcriptional repressor) of toxin-antitoxin stability system